VSPFGQIRDLHLEITSRCTLRCPRCQRTSNPEQLTVTDLPLEVVHASITRAAFPSVGLVNLCGNYGDAIYHPRFHDIISHLKSERFTVGVETNGAFRRRSWWRRTAELLDRGDRIVLSIDGLEDTNHMYRVNSRWADVEVAVQELRGHVFLIWKFIVFRHNQHQTEAARARAAALGFDAFRLVRSSRFDGQWRGVDGNDPLKPDPEWVGVRTTAVNRIAQIRRG
jgi:MoaA/NifB/PqqE/SkfB family radical SAM enzyme